MREIGVFCGTFNPIHWGHLMLAEFARDQFRLEKVYVVTSPNPPHRNDELLDAEERLKLVEIACRENPCFIASRLELDRDGPSYTVDTLKKIGAIEGGAGAPARLNLIIGQDNLAGLKDWHEPEKLFSLCRILVATRTSAVDKDEIARELPAQAQFELVDFPQLPISASLIRKRIGEDKTIMYMVPPAVCREIIASRFFKKQANNRRGANAEKA